MAITVYSILNCPQCNATYRALDKADIEYKVIDLTKDPAAFEMVKNLGYNTAPVVVTDDTHWAGFRPDQIKKLTLAAIAA